MKGWKERERERDKRTGRSPMLWHWCSKWVGMCGCWEGFLEEVCLVGSPGPGVQACKFSLGEGTVLKRVRNFHNTSHVTVQPTPGPRDHSCAVSQEKLVENLRPGRFFLSWWWAFKCRKGGLGLVWLFSTLAPAPFLFYNGKAESSLQYLPGRLWDCLRAETFGIDLSIKVALNKCLRKAMLKDVQITTQLYSFHMLARQCSKSFKLGFNNT